MLGGFDFDNMTGAEFPTVSVMLLLTYVVVVSIMLLNLLIAMMVGTPPVPPPTFRCSPFTLRHREKRTRRSMSVLQ